MSPSPAAVALALLLAAPAAAQEPVSAAEPAAAPVVRAVEVRSDARLSLAEVRALLAFDVGDALSDAVVRRSLRNFQASGLAARVAIYRRPAAAGGRETGEEGVVATVALWANLIVDEVKIVGDTGVVRPSELRGVVPQREGEPLLEGRLVRGVFAIQDRFEDRGYFRREVTLEPAIDEAARRATVVYRVTAGPRATVGEVRFDGEIAPFSAAELIAQLKLKPGEPFRRTALADDAGRLRSWLIGKKYRAARVDEPTAEFDAERGAAALTYPIAVGPLVTVTITGADMGKLRKKGLLPFLGDDGYDEALVLQAIDRLKSYYQGQGRYEVKIEDREERSDGTLALTLVIEPGPDYTLDEILFTGNEQIASDRLRERMETSAKSLLSLGSGRLVDETLASDLTNLRSYYALQGFRQVKIGPPQVDKQGRDLVLTLPVVEGPRERVAGLALEGMTVFDPKAESAKIPLAAGGPFHPRLLEDSLNRIRADYERDGYDQAQVSAESDWNADHTLVDLTLRVFEGPQTLVDRVIVRGNRATDEGVIRRVAALDRGKPVSRARLLDAERRLYRLGIFSRVDAELTPVPLGGTTRDVLIRVGEGKSRRITYGLGYDTEDGLGGLAGYTDGNLFGRAWSLSVDARVRQKRQQYRVFLDQPSFPGLRVPVTYTVFRLEEDRDSFVLTKWGTRVDVLKTLGDTRFGLSYDYRLVEDRFKAELPPSEIPREDQSLRISSLIPNFQIDRRDDPFNPSRGWNSVAQIQVSFPFLNATADFVKLFLQHTHYVPVGRLGVIAGSVRLGGIEPRAALDLPDPLIPPGSGLPNADVFIAERFFAGGASSHRAFDRDRLGLADRTLFPDAKGRLLPAGGNGLALVNLDFRFPIAGAVGGTVFFDSGNVWSDWRDVRTGDFRSGAGVGVRYLSPIGPIRVEIGWPLDRRLPGDDGRVIYLSLGNPF